MIKTKWFKSKHYAELYYGGSEYVSKEIIEDYDKEIERLNKRVKECEEAYLRTRHQYSELEGKYVIDEYVINELEKYHKIQMGIVSDEIDNQYCLGRYDSNYDSFQKLQELKGDSSNE